MKVGHEDSFHTMPSAKCTIHEYTSRNSHASAIDELGDMNNKPLTRSPNISRYDESKGEDRIAVIQMKAVLDHWDLYTLPI